MDARRIGTLVTAALAVAVVIALSPGAFVTRDVSTTPVYRVATRARIVALTVDDGPTSAYTRALLEMLSRERAHATFFVVGQRVEMRPDLVRREIAAGNEVADHTWSHPHLERLDPRAAELEIARGADAVRAATGIAPAYFRPPRGDTTAGAIAAARRLGMRTVLWSVAVEHDLHGTPPQMAGYVLSMVQPGSIILVHDGGGDRHRSLQALAIVLRGLRTRGYRVVTLGELFRAAR
jgi:peptidoglycan-N-acetylglucosamine deacetylase